ncbi:hypothetical protein [uncultured Roseobacter sp.]|uniref:hypothetical protein n=1 Tax=uncultured Roseobacter sp. TaxID=114847 RepID=UPI002638A7E2|nr:hypothetical protein [uncultured Roseobacter sp.]
MRELCRGGAGGFGGAVLSVGPERRIRDGGVMMWLVSYVVWRFLCLCTAAYDFFTGGVSRFGVTACLRVGLGLGAVLAWFQAAPWLPFSFILVFGVLDLAQSAIRRPERLNPFDVPSGEDKDGTRQLGLVSIAAAPFVGYVCLALLRTYGFAGGGMPL